MLLFAMKNILQNNCTLSIMVKYSFEYNGNIIFIWFKYSLCNDSLVFSLKLYFQLLNLICFILFQRNVCSLFCYYSQFLSRREAKNKEL